MSQLKSVNVPNPCHEAWQAMTPADGGRHCQSCCKTVTDFTVMAADDIIAYLASHTNICGRFNDGQIPHINNRLQPVNIPSMPKLKGWALLLAMLGPVSVGKLSAQNRPVTVQTNPDTTERNKAYMLGKVAVVQYKTVSGIVLDNTDGTPLPGAIITVPGFSTIAVTNGSGRFSMSLPVTTTELYVSYVGFDTNKVTIDLTGQQAYNITLKETPQWLGEVVVTKVVARPPFFKRVYYRLVRQPHRFLKRKLASI
jgi:hypothetical protein